MNDILDEFDSAEGLIIDLRANIGGDFTYAITEFGRLTEEERFIFRSRTKKGEGDENYTDWFDWNLSPAGLYFDKPIVLLTDRLTISAAERATMINGAAATKIGKELANGWDYSIVSQQLEFLDGKDYEGTGIPPDVYIANTKEEIEAGKDKVLEAAIALF